MKRLIVTVLLTLFWNTMPLAQTQDEMLAAVDKVRAPGTDFGFSLHAAQEKGGESDFEFDFRVQVKDTVKSLVTYESPVSSKGKRLLMVEQNMWVYVPGTRQSIRISPQQQLLGPMSNADVARVVYSIDYLVKSTADGVLDGQDVLNLSLVPRSEDNPYRSIELTVAKNDHRPLQAKFFALSGRLLKTIVYKDYQMVLGAERPMRMEIMDEVEVGKRVVMIYKDFQIMQTPDMYFQRDYLPRLK